MGMKERTCARSASCAAPPVPKRGAAAPGRPGADGRGAGFSFARLAVSPPQGRERSSLQAQKGGETWCDVPAGKVKKSIYNTQCDRECTEEHEEFHAIDIRECCAEAGKRYKASDAAGKAEAQKTWDDWMIKNRSFFECRGYAMDVLCHENRLKYGKLSDECYTHMARQKDVLEGIMNNFCGVNAVLVRCPFFAEAAP